MNQSLVSILIPTHNRLNLFKIAFHSALNQTYKNIEIVISDDSDNDETFQYIKPYLTDKRVKYKWNKGFSALQNWRWLMEHCSGDYFNFLMDDDVFALDKIEKMLDVYENNANISLVTSYRQLIDINGQKLQDIAATKPIVANSSIIPGDKVYKEVLKSSLNFIGEPTTVLIKGKYKPIMKRMIEVHNPIGDLMVWLELCNQGDVVYLTEPLSFFRMHSGNDQNRPITVAAGLCGWGLLYKEAYRESFDDEWGKFCLNKFIECLVTLIGLWNQVLSDKNEDQKEIKKYQPKIDDMIETYLKEIKDEIIWEETAEVAAFINKYIKNKANVKVIDNGSGMKAVILAGGHGTRISEESQYKPKPMIEIGGMPILWHIMKEYSAYGINEFIICAGYKQEMIKEWFNNYFLYTNDVTFDFAGEKISTLHHKTTEPWKVTVVDTGMDTMTGGRIKRIEPYIGSDNDFLMTYGDAVCDVDIKKLIEYHKQKGKIGTLTTVMQEQSKGVLNIAFDNSVRSFREKSQRDKVPINAGYMVLNRKIFNYLSGDECVFEKEPLQKLVEEGELMSYNHHGFWQCMDTLLEKQILEELLKNGKASWKKWN